MTTDDHAEMSVAVFDKLADYSHSLPSGVYIGKRWKRHGPDAWWMGEYADDPDPDQARIIWREIFITDHYVRRATDENLQAFRNAAAVEKALTA